MARIRVDAQKEEGVYHCMSRTVNGEFLFEPEDREVLRKQIWQVAEYCGLQVVTYAILSNHFHVLVRVPVKESVGDEELLRRYALLYPQSTRGGRLERLRKILAEGMEEAEQWRRRQLKQMGDLSEYMKLLKMRYVFWYNRNHKRYGTLWSERFKSVLVEDGPALRTIAAYIDLNCVRAGLAEDPKDYRFCGYAEAIAGHSQARSGIEFAMAGAWREVSCGYRQTMVGSGWEEKPSSERLGRAVAAGETLPMTTVLRCRIRYFTQGAVLGSKAYVGRQLAEQKQRHGRLRDLEPKPLLAVTNWMGLTILRGPRSLPIS